MTTTIAKIWRQLSGQDHWKGLLDPLDINLRRYIIHYGERAQATYDAFNSNRYSKYAGSSRYSKENLFARVGLRLGNPYKYMITKYFYATSSVSVPEAFIVKSLSREAWCKESNWMGYVAVTSDEGKGILGRRDILVAWRGSVQSLEWVMDFDSPLVPATKVFGKASNALVHNGFLSIYTSDDPKSPFNKASARDQVLSELKRLVQIYKDEEISITIAGHSLGGALGTLNAVDIVVKKINIVRNKTFPVTAFIFACPHVGDSNFLSLFQSMDDLRLLRVRNLLDVAPLHPLLPGYCDVGEELVINTQKSQFLKSLPDVERWHSFEAYLHGVAGTQGENDFRLEVKRDISLVNKRNDSLKDEYLVPPSWWGVDNKGMVQKVDGSWMLDEKNDNDDM